MKYLLDTHTLIWTITDKKKLSKKATDILEDSKNIIYSSAINLWEISLKFSVGKLSLEGFSPEQIPGLIEKMGFKILLPEAHEYSTFHQLPTHHRDPFDRMLIWQAIQQNMVLITKDDNMNLYRAEGLKIIW